MHLWNLFILHKVKPIWLGKLIANVFGFIVLYPITLHNKETALLLSLFLAAYLYRNMQTLNANLQNDSTQSKDSKTEYKIDSKDYKQQLQQTKIHDFAITQFMISCFCACLFITTSLQIYAICASFGCIFIRIYDYYKPSLIGRFYTMQTNLISNHILGGILGSILCGILSGASVMLIYFLYIKLEVSKLL